MSPRWAHICALVLHMPIVDGLQLLGAIRLSLFCLGGGVRERWCNAHPCLVWENSPWWWFEFKAPGAGRSFGRHLKLNI